MLRNLFIALLFIALPYLGNAQGYYNVTHTSGKRIIAGVEVEVVPIDSPGVYPDPSYCVGPYFIGTTAARKTPVTNGYEFRFSVPVRQVGSRSVRRTMAKSSAPLSTVVFLHSTQLICLRFPAAVIADTVISQMVK